MAGLAGGALAFAPVMCAAEAGAQPGPATPLVAALQAAFPEATAEPLRLSQAMATLPAAGGAEPSGPGDGPAQLRAASELRRPPAPVQPTAAAAGERAAAGGRDAPLRLSQQLTPRRSSAANPRWMSLPDDPPQLRAARGLALPVGGRRSTVPGTTGAPGAEPDDETDAGGAAIRFAGAPAGEAPAAGSAVAAPADTGIAGLGWEIPPIRWGGSLGYSLQKATSGSGGSSSSQGVFANLNASSYIYAPWFATVSGRLGITSSSSSSQAASQAGAMGSSSDSKSSNLVGGGEVNMFSSSRYPFRAYFDRSDSRASGNFVANDYVNTRFGLTQNYRADDSLSSGSFMLDRSAIDNSNGRQDRVTALSGSYATQTGIVQHSFNGRYSLGERQGSGERALLTGFNSSHNANLSEFASLSTTVNYSDSDIRTADSTGGLTSNRGRFLQVYSYGSWMPEFEDLDDLPLTLTGSLRYATQETQFGSGSATAQTIGGNLSALYRFSNNLTTALNTAVNHVTLSDGGSRLISLIGSNINYVGNPLTFGNFSYNWNAGGNANWQSGVGDTPANTIWGANASHSVARVYRLENGHTFSLNLSQTLSWIDSQSIGASESFSNNLSANYGMYLGERFSGSLTALLSDVNTSGANAQHYSSFNLGMVGQGQLSQVSTANVNLMFTWTDQTHQTVDAFGTQTNTSTQRMSINGSATYSHQRFADIRGLRYNLVFAADNRLRDDRLYGNFNTEQDRSRYSLTNRLDYQIGLLNFRLSLVNNDVGGKKNALLFFQVTRQIGSY